jgi:tRNA dimethylallyltransferase
MPPRDLLHAACERRCRAMIEQGALEEVKALLAQRLSPDLPAMKALGVRELGRYLSGELDRDAALTQFQQATRQYAKRQYTWFRHQLRAAQCWNAQFSESLGAEIISFIRNCVDRADSTV